MWSTFMWAHFQSFTKFHCLLLDQVLCSCGILCFIFALMFSLAVGSLLPEWLTLRSSHLKNSCMRFLIFSYFLTLFHFPAFLCRDKNPLEELQFFNQLIFFLKKYKIKRERNTFNKGKFRNLEQEFCCSQVQAYRRAGKSRGNTEEQMALIRVQRNSLKFTGVQRLSHDLLWSDLGPWKLFFRVKTPGPHMFRYWPWDFNSPSVSTTSSDTTVLKRFTQNNFLCFLKGKTTGEIFFHLLFAQIDQFLF